MNLKDKKGSISIYVLIALLFMLGFLIISYGNNLNKSKIVKEQFNIIKDIYTYSGDEEGAYNKAYADLRNKNKQTMTASSEGAEDTASLELTKTFQDSISNYRIYGAADSVGDIVNLFHIKDRVDVGDIGVDQTGWNLSNLNETSYSYKNNYQTVQHTINGNNSLYIGQVTTNGAGLQFPFYAKQNTTYTLSYKVVPDEEVTKVRNRVYFLNSDGEMLSTFDKWQNVSEEDGMYVKQTFTTTEDTYYMVIQFETSEGCPMLFENIQLEEGDVATEYIPYGTYRIPIRLTNESGESTIKSIYLDTPLKDGEYIDFKEGKVIRNDVTEEVVRLPELEIYEDYTKIEVLTEVKPSKIEVEYQGYTLD